MRILASSLVLSFVVGVGSPVTAQSPLQAQFGDTSNGNPSFGVEAVASLGDVDGDGIPDYAVGSKKGANLAGDVRVFSGGTGAEIVTLQGNGAWFVDQSGGSDRFGASIAGPGDLDGDLVPDLVVGAPEDDLHGLNRGVIQVFSGATWTMIREHTGSTGFFGRHVAALGDADGDGAGDYLVVENGSKVHAFSGATGALMWTHQAGPWDELMLGPTTGDANGDGLGDALVGVPGIGSHGDYALVLDGATGTEIHSVSGPTTSDLGQAVTWLEDMNADGRDEFAVSAYKIASNVTVYDGATAATLYGVSGDPAIGRYITGVGDQDGDGIADFVAQHFHGARLHSGADGGLIHVYNAVPLAPQHGGLWLAPAGDLDGDGRQEVLQTVHGSGPGITGLSSQAVIAFSSKQHSFEDLGHALGGAAADPVLTIDGAMLPGSLFQVELSTPSTGAPTYFIAGLSGVYQPLLGGILVPSPDIVLPGLSTNGSGNLEFWFSFPPGLPSGTTLYVQGWLSSVDGPLGVTASNAVRGTVP